MPLLPDIEALQNGEIGDVLARGMADLLKHKPNFPVDYLANWLLNHNRIKQNQKDLEQHFEKKKAFQQNLQKEKENQEASQRLQSQQEAEARNQDQTLHEEIKSNEELFTYLKTKLPQVLKDRYGFSGVYIGQYEQVQDEPAKIKYIGYSDN